MTFSVASFSARDFFLQDPQIENRQKVNFSIFVKQFLSPYEIQKSSFKIKR